MVIAGRVQRRAAAEVKEEDIVEFRESLSPSSEAPHGTTDGQRLPEHRDRIDAARPATPASTPPAPKDWRGKLWQTSRTVFWNWD